MTGSAAGAGGFLSLLKELWNLFLLLMRNLQPLLVIAMLILVAWALLSRQPWPFSISADTEHVTLDLAGDVETNWRIDGALLCLRAGVADVALPPAPQPGPCPGRRWRGYDLRQLSEVALRLPGVPGNGPGYTARLDVDGLGGLAIQLDAGARGTPAQLFAEGGDPLALPGDLLLVFPPPQPGQALGRLLLPFSGTGSIGRDVAWHEPSLLRGGSVAVYTRSDEAAGGRDLVASTDLLPGDRIDLSQGQPAGSAVAKGFVHYDLLPEPDGPPVMRVVAFGEADSVRIVRYGDQGYGLSPGLVARLTRHSAVATWAVLLLSLLGLMAVYREASEIGEGHSLSERAAALAARWRQRRDP